MGQAPDAGTTGCTKAAAVYYSRFNTVLPVIKTVCGGGAASYNKCPVENTQDHSRQGETMERTMKTPTGATIVPSRPYNAAQIETQLLRSLAANAVIEDADGDDD